MHLFVKKLLIFLLLIAVLPIVSFTRPAPAKPNIVVIFMDDMGYGDLECYGGIPYHTPNINRLAAEGMRFTQFYAAQGVCSASRAAMMTGCYPNRVGIHGALGPRADYALQPGEETLAEVLKANGYATGMVGKWHLGSKQPYLPLQQGFDEYLGLPYSNDMWPVHYDGRPINDTTQYRGRYPLLPLIDGNNVSRYIRTLDDQAELTQLYTRRALDFIGRNRDKPFFLYFAHSMVHVPIAASAKFRGKSGAGLFGDVVEEVDWSVGEVMKKLKTLGLDKNTLVIFTSDNGPWRNYGNHAGSTGGLREGKGSAWEGGMRVPAIMRWPGQIPAGTISNKLACNIDVLPTVAKATGAKLPAKKIDGVDLTSLFHPEKNSTPRQDLVYYYDRNNLKCVRKGKWKITFPCLSRTYRDFPPGADGFPGQVNEKDSVKLALYDLQADPGETIDVKDLHPDVMAELNAIADRYREELGDDLTGRTGSGNRPAAKVTW
ncbi:MAG: sulfatase [Mucilaginibacter polytrichastri]|nr:sulfatase [Mucilaginibacter polytrichastri]